MSGLDSVLSDSPAVPRSTRSPRKDSARPTPRRAIVCGGGGVLGFAWMLGALAAIESEAGLDLRDSEVMVGTSAGAVLSAMLGCGVSVSELVRQHQGLPAVDDMAIDWDYDTVAGGALPPRPGWRPGSPRLLAGAMRHPRRVGPFLAICAALPAGRGSLAAIHDVVLAVSEATGNATQWPQSPRPWIVATDYRSGERVVFGRDVDARLPEAVIASCAIPAWYAPVAIDGRRYVDGGMVSNASCDLLLGAELDEVYAVLPMASVQPLGRPRTMPTRIERKIRHAVTRSVLTDVLALRAQGTRVVLVTPGVEDLDLMGVNLMNPRRRIEVLDTARRTATEQIRTGIAGATEAVVAG